MTTEPIIESGMTFGPYPEGYCFHIEKSKIYKKIQKDVKIAEFLLYRVNKKDQPMVWIIEAKSSSPKPTTQPNFDHFIQEIKEKLFNTLFLCIAIKSKRHDPFTENPEFFNNIDLEKTSFRLILIIKHHKDEWLAPLKDDIEKVLIKPIIKYLEFTILAPIAFCSQRCPC
ncbi:hypothetical protein VB712_15600 [Spirulina sp. CCNP1310]|uniref:hypothetical protein n=1 Tax=Spirulina sp. CCNP1310 TaxID=3110249 RepID=UPI002B1FFB4C|nr:hypothetical protein [Spirulina sp. CCNP1310]MEA5420658.1 hypothetical protein [Spirulina sp. CCNP1310]